VSVNEKMALRKVFGPKEEEVKGEYRKVYNEAFYGLCITNVYSDDQITDGDTGEAGGIYGGREIHIVMANKLAGKR
jgi:hypothetical protein